jgi:hypothetical protein
MVDWKVISQGLTGVGEMVMAMIRGRQVWLFVLATALLGGCGKQVSLTFLNLTSDTLDVYVTTPQEGRKEVGMVAPMGTLQYDLLIPTSQLPAQCSWQTGSVSKVLIVTKDTGPQECTILPTGGAQMRDRDSSLKDEIDREINPVPAGPPSGP